MVAQDGSTTLFGGDHAVENDPQPGERCGDWILQEAVGSGGFGKVFAARHAHRGDGAAIKILHTKLVENVRAVSRFEQEAELLQGLEVPGVVRVLELGALADGRRFFAMERLYGRDLKQRLREEGRLTPETTLDLVSQVATALDRAHAFGVVHRDVKPSNVFVCHSQGGGVRVVLLDFGLAKLIDGSGPELTASREIIGTPASMAPEQVLGQRVDARTDVYGLGALTFQALTGRAPFEHDSVLVLCQLHLHARVPNVSSLVPTSSLVDTVVARALSKDPAHRFESCGQFVNALAEAMGGGARSAGALEQVLAIRARVSAPPELLAAGVEEVLADYESVLCAARSRLEASGFKLTLRVGNVVTAQLELAMAERAVGLGAALALAHELENRAARHADVHVQILVATGTVASCHTLFLQAEGSLPRTETYALFAESALAGLNVEATPSPAVAGFFSVRSHQPTAGGA